jgi:cell division protein ZapE
VALDPPGARRPGADLLSSGEGSRALPLALLEERIAAGALEADPLQRAAAERLARLARELAETGPAERPRGLLARLTGGRPAAPAAPRGVYLHGDPGRGKSMLVDLFVASVPIEAKRRVHFHELMLEVHGRLRALRAEADRADPVALLARELAGKLRLLCLDELEVRDIADAMIVSRLFQRLLERGVVVVATSNRHPDELYKDGLQREKFLPFIDLLKTKLDVLMLEAEQDYRLGRLMGAPVYYNPLGPEADAALDRAWARLTDGAAPRPDAVTVQGRRIEVPAAAHQVARFSFAELCDRPLGPADYMAIAAQFSTVILNGIPQMSEERKDAARRFVTLVDALYEHRTVLICAAAVPPPALYTGREGGFEFQRTVSRLIEMQAMDYIRQRHRED